MTQVPDFPTALVEGVSPAALRNAGPICTVVQALLHEGGPANAEVLEIASGGGYHACVFAKAMPQHRWQPTEADTMGCEQIATRVRAASLPNLRRPLMLDVMELPWPVARADAMVCINMIHISPWAATLALFAGAARLLPPGGLLATYGPYRIQGDYQAESNRTFDESLRARNATWGVRDIAELDDTATAQGFARILMQAMPANNHMLAFRKG